MKIIGPAEDVLPRNKGFVVIGKLTDEIEEELERESQRSPEPFAITAGRLALGSIGSALNIVGSSIRDIPKSLGYEIIPGAALANIGKNIEEFFIPEKSMRLSKLYEALPSKIKAHIAHIKGDKQKQIEMESRVNEILGLKKAMTQEEFEQLSPKEQLKYIIQYNKIKKELEDVKESSWAAAYMNWRKQNIVDKSVSEKDGMSFMGFIDRALAYPEIVFGVLYSMGLSVGAGLAGAAGFQEMSKNLNLKASVINDLFVAREDADFSHKLTAAVTSLVAFVGSAYLSAGTLARIKMLSASAKNASAVAFATALESIVTAENAWQEKYLETGSEVEATEASRKAFLLNVGALGITNKLLFSPGLRGWKKAPIAAIPEGMQESIQSDIHSLVINKGINIAENHEEFILGYLSAVIGKAGIDYMSDRKLKALDLAKAAENAKKAEDTARANVKLDEENIQLTQMENEEKLREAIDTLRGLKKKRVAGFTHEQIHEHFGDEVYTARDMVVKLKEIRPDITNKEVIQLLKKSGFIQKIKGGKFKVKKPKIDHIEKVLEEFAPGTQPSLPFENVIKVSKEQEPLSPQPELPFFGQLEKEGRIKQEQVIQEQPVQEPPTTENLFLAAVNEIDRLSHEVQSLREVNNQIEQYLLRNKEQEAKIKELEGVQKAENVIGQPLDILPTEKESLSLGKKAPTDLIKRIEEGDRELIELAELYRDKLDKIGFMKTAEDLVTLRVLSDAIEKGRQKLKKDIILPEEKEKPKGEIVTVSRKILDIPESPSDKLRTAQELVLEREKLVTEKFKEDKTVEKPIETEVEEKPVIKQEVIPIKEIEVEKRPKKKVEPEKQVKVKKELVEKPSNLINELKNVGTNGLSLFEYIIENKPKTFAAKLFQQIRDKKEITEHLKSVSIHIFDNPKNPTTVFYNPTNNDIVINLQGNETEQLVDSLLAGEIFKAITNKKLNENEAFKLAISKIINRAEIFVQINGIQDENLLNFLKSEENFLVGISSSSEFRKLLDKIIIKGEQQESNQIKDWLKKSMPNFKLNTKEWTLLDETIFQLDTHLNLNIQQPSEFISELLESVNSKINGLMLLEHVITYRPKTFVGRFFNSIYNTQKITDQLMDVSVHILNNFEKPTTALYDAKNHRIVINLHGNESDSLVENLIAEEIGHALTVRKLQSNDKFREMIRKAIQIVKSYTDSKRLESEEEFIAGVWTSPQLRALLDSIILSETKPPKSLFDRIKRWIKRVVFEFKPNSKDWTLLDEVFSNMDTIMKADMPIHGEGIFYSQEQDAKTIKDKQAAMYDALTRVGINFYRQGYTDYGSWSKKITEITDAIPEKVLKRTYIAIKNIVDTNQKTYEAESKFGDPDKPVAWYKEKGSKVKKPFRLYRGNPRIPLTESIVNMLTKIDRDVKISFFETAPFAFKWIDKTFGTDLTNILLVPAEIAQKIARMKVVDRLNHLQEVIKQHKLGLKNFNNIMSYAILQQKGGEEALSLTNQPKVRTLTTGEKALYDKMVEFLEYDYYQFNEARRIAGKPPIEKVENYFTWQRVVQSMYDSGVDPVTVDNSQFIAMSETPMPYAKRRTEDVKEQFELNAIKVFHDYQQCVQKYINMTPVLAKGREMLKFMEAAKISTKAPRIYTFLHDWINYEAGIKKTELFGSHKLAVMTNKLTRNISDAVMVGNLKVMITQLSSFDAVTAKVGLNNVMKGLRMYFSSQEYRDMVEKDSNVYVIRAPETAMIDSYYTILMTYSRSGVPILQQAKDIFNAMKRYGYKHIQIIDAFVAKVTWLAGYNYAKSRGMSDPKQFADRLLINTQASASSVHLSQLQKTVLGRAFSLFGTFVINRYNWLKHEIVLPLVKGKHMDISRKDAFRTLIKYYLVAAFVDWLYEEILGVNSPNPTPFKSAYLDYREYGDKWKALFVGIAEALGNLPVVGSGVRYGGSVFGPVAGHILDIAQGMSKEAGYYHGYTPPFAELFFKTLGVPTQQIKTIYYGVKEDKNLIQTLFGGDKRRTGLIGEMLD